MPTCAHEELLPLTPEPTLIKKGLHFHQGVNVYLSLKVATQTKRPSTRPATL